MAGTDYERPKTVQDFYLFDPLVEHFVKILDEHLTPLFATKSSSGTTDPHLLEFIGATAKQQEITSDGGETEVSGNISLSDYLTQNTAFAHHLYDELKKHYELRKKGYWSREGLKENLNRELKNPEIHYPHEVSFVEYIQNNLGLDYDKQIISFIDHQLSSNSNVIGRVDRNLNQFFCEYELGKPSTERIRSQQGFDDDQKFDALGSEVYKADARYLVPAGESKKLKKKERRDEIPLDKNSIDLIITSPPYWKKREYFDDEDETELGQESSVDDYVEHLVEALERWKIFLRPTGSVFLNIGDSYYKKSLQGIPGLFAKKAQEQGWIIRNEIAWTKENGVPSPVDDRLTGRHEQIFHLVMDDNYFYDREAYISSYNTGSNPNDIWQMSHDRNAGKHLAPFPEDLVRRAVTLACPPQVCTECQKPRRRITNKHKDQLISDEDEDFIEHLIRYDYYKLNPRRKQAQRAIKRFVETESLTFDHLRAVQAVGISDAGKAKEFQTVAGRNSKDIEQFAEEAKEELKGYFREFTFPQRQTVRWSKCDCEASFEPGRVFDPFAGSGTTISVANELGYHAYGTDLDTSHSDN